LIKDRRRFTKKKELNKIHDFEADERDKLRRNCCVYLTVVYLTIEIVDQGEYF